MKRRTLVTLALLVCAALISTPHLANAQFGGLKDKLKQKAKEKVDKKVDETVDGKKETPKDTAEPASKEEPGAAKDSSSEGVAEGAPKGDNFALYTKYDFVPGDKVYFFDDVSGEEVGEFPSRWNLGQGVFEVAAVNKENWIMASANGTILPKLGVPELPEKYTVEFDFLNMTKVYDQGWSFTVQWVDAEGKDIAEFIIRSGRDAAFRIVENGSYSDKSSKLIPESFATGVHAIRIMATKSSFKCYIDNERLVNVPKVEGFKPANFRLDFSAYRTDWPRAKMFIKNFRFAEGGKSLKQQLDEAGRIVTHGILFDSGSDKIKAESYKTLADIGTLLTDNPTLKVSIEGHTDSDGADDYNMKLSQRRSESVRTYLVENYKVDTGRLEAKGWGESKPIDNNTSPEGKANNRRVELVKL